MSDSECNSSSRPQSTAKCVDKCVISPLNTNQLPEHFNRYPLQPAKRKYDKRYRWKFGKWSPVTSLITTYSFDSINAILLFI